MYEQLNVSDFAVFFSDHSCNSNLYLCLVGATCSLGFLVLEEQQGHELSIVLFYGNCVCVWIFPRHLRSSCGKEWVSALCFICNLFATKCYLHCTPALPWKKCSKSGFATAQLQNLFVRLIKEWHAFGMMTVRTITLLEFCKKQSKIVFMGFIHGSTVCILYALTSY